VALLELRERGLYCAAGDFYIDPWEPVDRAVITHAHSDHARPGSKSYLTVRAGEVLLRARIGADAAVQSIDYEEGLAMDGVRLSLHPAGHILGSAQVRLEHGGEVWVVSGDYKLAPDATCRSFEPLRCHTFVTESTFGLPIFRWADEREVIASIHAWWRTNREAGRASLLFAHPLGKAQRLLTLMDDSIGPIYTHGAVERMNAIYRGQGIPLVPTVHAGPEGEWRHALIVAPPSAHGSQWERRFGTVSTAFASGWMRIRGTRRRRSLDRGFAYSDHADWPGLLWALEETHAECVWVTHGYRGPLVRWLEEHGRKALAVEARFESEVEEPAGEEET
jgi:putative mRNA 3-end processing factor